MQKLFDLKRDFLPSPYTHRMFDKEHNLGEKVFEMIPLDVEVLTLIFNVCVDILAKE